MINLKKVFQPVINKFCNAIMSSDDEIDGKVKKYLKEHPSKAFIYSDIAYKLDIDLASVVRSCMRLEKRGVIKGLKNEIET